MRVYYKQVVEEYQLSYLNNKPIKIGDRDDLLKRFMLNWIEEASEDWIAEIDSRGSDPSEVDSFSTGLYRFFYVDE